MPSQSTLVVARTPKGAERAARLALGDVSSRVYDDDPTTFAEDLIPEGEFHEVIVECPTENAEWLLKILTLVRARAGSGVGVRLVLPPAAYTSLFEATIEEAFGGWIVSGVGVDGDVIWLRLVASSDDFQLASTLESLKGAAAVATLLYPLSDPTTFDLPDFEYQSSMVMGYLTETPRLHSEIEGLQREVQDLVRSNEDLARGRKSAALRRFGDSVTTDSSPTTGARTSSHGRSRLVLVIAAIAALIVVGAVAWWAATKMQADPAIVMGILILGVVVLVGLDNRRRMMRSHAQIRTLNERLDRRFEKEKGAVLEAIHEVADRVLASVNAATLRMSVSTDALAQTSSTTKESVVSLAEHVGELQTTVQSESNTLYRQMEGNLRLRDFVDVTGPTPALRGWAASPDVLAFLVTEMLRLRPATVIECGSGASTVWLAMACKTAGLATTLVALEHDPVFAAETRRVLHECGVADLAEVRLAPLEEVSLPDYEGLWYSREALSDLDEIGLVFVDGPPGETGDIVRYPALPLLWDRLAESVTVVLDDLIRHEERQVARRWVQEFPDLGLETKPFEKGAAVLRRAGGSPADTGTS